MRGLVARAVDLSVEEGPKLIVHRRCIRSNAHGPFLDLSVYVGLGVLCGTDGGVPKAGREPNGLVEHLFEVVSHCAAYRAGER